MKLNDAQRDALRAIVEWDYGLLTMTRSYLVDSDPEVNIRTAHVLVREGLAVFVSGPDGGWIEATDKGAAVVAAQELNTVMP